MIKADITEEEVKNFKGLLNYFKQLANDGVIPIIEKQIRQRLDYAIPFFFALTSSAYFDELRRITINRNVQPDGSNRRISNISQLKYPPADKVAKYGRCNLPGQSIFYSSPLNFTALNEMKPKVGDLITETTWKLKVNEPLLYCPIFKNQPTKEGFINEEMIKYEAPYERMLTRYPQYAREQINTLVQFIADSFTQRFESGNHLDYIFSAYFSDKIFNTLEGGKIEAIYYPSVKESLSFQNVALKPDVLERKYKLVKVRDSVVVKDPSDGDGQLLTKPTGECKTFDLASGKIGWKSDANRVHQIPEEIQQFRFLFGVLLDEASKPPIIVPPY